MVFTAVATMLALLTSPEPAIARAKADFDLVCLLDPPAEWRNSHFVSISMETLKYLVHAEWPRAKVIYIQNMVEPESWARVVKSIGCDTRRAGALNIYSQFYLLDRDRSYTVALFVEWNDGSGHAYRSRSDWERLEYLAPPPIDSSRPKRDALGVMPYAVNYDILDIWNTLAPALGARSVPLPTIGPRTVH